MMRRIFLLILIAVALSTISCRRERSCQCTQVNITSFGGNSSRTSTTYKYTKEKQKLNDIRDYGFKGSQSCQSYSTTQTYTTGMTKTTDVKCELKDD